MLNLVKQYNRHHPHISGSVALWTLTLLTATNVMQKQILYLSFTLVCHFRERSLKRYVTIWQFVISRIKQYLCLQTWWKGSSLYSFLAGGHTDVPPASPSEEKRQRSSLFCNLQTCLWANLCPSHLSLRCRTICTQHSAGSLPTSSPPFPTRVECSPSLESSDLNIWSCSWSQIWGHPDGHSRTLFLKTYAPSL